MIEKLKLSKDYLETIIIRLSEFEISSLKKAI